MSRENGQWYETLAEKHLLQQGLKLVDKNYHSYRGEIDLVMLDKQSLVFVEVRFRKNSNYGSAAESITLQKQQRLTLAARHFLQRHRHYQDSECRFDVIAITGSIHSSHPQIDWIKNAFLT